MGGYIKYHKKHDVSIIKFADIRKDKQGTKNIFSLEYIEYIDILEEAKLPIVGIDEGKCKKFNDVLIANEVIVFGYPRSIGIKKIPQIEYDKPLLRKGIVAGKNNKVKTIVIDCPTYQGYSGGPVIEINKIDIHATVCKVIGLVSQFVPFMEEWKNVTIGYSNFELSNSGYSIVTPIEVAFELLNKTK